MQVVVADTKISDIATSQRTTSVIPDLLLMDERLGRAATMRLWLKVIGVRG